MNKKAIGSIALCRVSTSEQALTGHSLPRQQKNVEVAATNLNAPIARLWSLDQSSRAGKNFNRKDLAEMVAFVKANQNIKYLIVDEVDRFMRDIKYFYYFEAVFEQLGVTVHYASQPELNNNDQMAKFQKLFTVFKAEASNDERIGKTNNGLRERVRLGYYPFPVPQGYKTTTTKGLFEPDNLRFPLLQSAFQEVLAGYTPAEVLRRLNQKGYKTPQGKELSLNRLMNILRTSYYAGAIRIGGWDFTNEQGLHKRMISLADFEQLQLMLSGKKFKEPRKSHNPEYPLSSLMDCTECGGKLVGFLHRNGNGGSWDKYRCRKCNKMFHKLDVHGALDAILTQLELKEESHKDFINSLEQIWKQQQCDAIGHIKILESRKDELKVEKGKYLKALAETPELKSDFLNAISEVEQKLNDIEKDIAGAKSIDEDLVEFVQFAIDFVCKQKENWWELPYADMIKCKQLLFPGGFSINYDKKVYTPQISPLFRLNTTKNSHQEVTNFSLVEVARVALASKIVVVAVLHV